MRRMTEAAPRTFALDAVPAAGNDAPLPLTAARAPSKDRLIFRVSGSVLSLVGGTGRGAGWMGIVDLPRESEPLADRVIRASAPAHVDARDEPRRIVGPYWAAHALLVPVEIGRASCRERW